MMLFPGISQIQTALLGVVLGSLIGGASIGWAVHRIDNGRYEQRETELAKASSAALKKELATSAALQKNIDVANDKASKLAAQLDAERAKKQTVLHDTLLIEGKKDAPLAACLSRQLPADVLRNLVR